MLKLQGIAVSPGVTIGALRARLARAARPMTRIALALAAPASAEA